tara:strand:+ start:107 stop:439 length:333 start_codon:yes stop_codon:yes gene_type:complete
MCLKCHLGLSDSNILNQMKNIETHQFTECNSTSISHFIIAASGFNGKEVRKISIQVLENYYNWLKVNPEYILNDNLSLKHIEMIIKKIHTNSVEHHDQDQILYYLNDLYI